MRLDDELYNQIALNTYINVDASVVCMALKPSKKLETSEGVGQIP
jgi:hypothetical protein